MSEASYRTDTPYTPHTIEASGSAGRPLRILIPSYRSNPHTGGQGVYLRFLSRALVDLGHNVDVISGPPYPDLDERVGLIKLPSLDLYAKPKTWLGIPAMPASAWTNWPDAYEYFAHISGAFAEPTTFGMRLARYMKTHHGDYDIVHDNQTLCRGLLAVEKMGVPVIGALHHPISRDRRISLDATDKFGMRLLVRRWYSFLEKQIKVAHALPLLTVCSDSTRRDAITDFHLPGDKLELVYLGIDEKLFRPLPHIEREERRLITTASADVPLKGLSYLIEAYGSLLEEFPDLKLTVIGTLREGLTSKMLDAKGIRDKVEFVSGLTFDQIVELYARATIAVCPSVYEGFGLPAGEAMSCGVPLVATTGGSLPEVVGDAGLIVPPKDPIALGDAIATYLRDPSLRHQMGRKGRERITQHFTWERTARQLTDIYHRFLPQTAKDQSDAHGRNQIASA